MSQNVVIPYNDKCDEAIYKCYYDRMTWLIYHLEIRVNYTKLCDLARSLIIDHLVTHNSYQQYYTIHQVNHLSERFASAFISGQKQLYIY